MENQSKGNAYHVANRGQGQSKRPQAAGQESIKYGDAFSVSAGKPIAPEDDAKMRVIGQYVEPTPTRRTRRGDVRHSAVTIGEALVAAAQTAGNKAVEQSDAAAIQAAEVRASGSTLIIPGGLSATAQSAATYNEGLIRDQDKIKLSSILRDATARLSVDKAATSQDAEGVITAELRNNPKMSTRRGGVAASVAAAARLNERDQGP